MTPAWPLRRRRWGGRDFHRRDRLNPGPLQNLNLSELLCHAINLGPSELQNKCVQGRWSNFLASRPRATGRQWARGLTESRSRTQAHLVKLTSSSRCLGAFRPQQSRISGHSSMDSQGSIQPVTARSASSSTAGATRDDRWTGSESATREGACAKAGTQVPSRSVGSDFSDCVHPVIAILRYCAAGQGSEASRHFGRSQGRRGRTRPGMRRAQPRALRASTTGQPIEGLHSIRRGGSATSACGISARPFLHPPSAAASPGGTDSEAASPPDSAGWSWLQVESLDRLLDMRSGEVCPHILPHFDSATATALGA